MMPSVLVVGTTVNFWADELEIVEMLRTSLKDRAIIVYRPHPRRGGDWTWQSHLQLQEQLIEASCVVAAFSTVVIEAALLGKPSLLVGFGESAHGPGGAAYHAELQHMAEVATWPGVRLCRSQGELLMCLNLLVTGNWVPDPDELRRRAQEVARSDGHARERIAEAVEAFGRQGHF